MGAAWVVSAFLLNDATKKFDISRTDDTIDVVIGTKYLELATDFRRRLLALHLELVDAIERELEP